MHILKKVIAAVAAAAFAASAITGCHDKNMPERTKKEFDKATASGESVTQLGSFTITLYPDDAPITCENFEKLVKEGFYDGLTFHRVVDDFMAQGGDPNGNGMGGPGYCIKGEFFFNGVKNDLKHKRGVLSMARSSSPNSAGSQFFIMHADAKHLDGQYAAFGKVTSGMDVVDAIASVQTDRSDRPQVEQKIASITVDTHGETYPEPNKLPDPYGRF